MRKVSPRLVAIMMAGVVSVTSIAPVTAYNHVTVNAAQLQQQEIDWTFTGNGKVDNDKIQLSGAGDNIGILLRGIEREQIERGQVVVKPGSVSPHTEFEAEVYILKKEEGGRHTPFSKGYKPQFYFRTTDVTGEVELPADKEMVMPGDTLTFNVKLLAPIAMEQGLNFAIREGGRTVGAGVVTKITT